MMKPDILIKIVYGTNASGGEDVKIFTNARKDNDALDEILGNWLQDQAGRNGSRDPSCKPEEIKLPVTITIGLDLSDDSWGFASTSGSRAFDTGVVMSVLKRLASIPKGDLAEFYEART